MHKQTVLLLHVRVTMKIPIFKLFILEVVIVLVVVITLLLAKPVSAAEQTEFNINIGLQSLNGQSEINPSDSINILEIPVALSAKNSGFYYGVELKKLKAEYQGLNKQGYGDTTLTFGYDLNKQFQISLKEKLAFTSTKGLSTGVNDTSIQLDFNSEMSQANRSLFATIGYTFTEKSRDYRLQNRPYISLGTGFKLKSNTQFKLNLKYRQNIFAELDDQLGLKAVIDQPLNNTYNLSAFAGIDNTQTSTIGVTLNGKF